MKLTNVLGEELGMKTLEILATHAKVAEYVALGERDEIVELNDGQVVKTGNKITPTIDDLIMENSERSGVGVDFGMKTASLIEGDEVYEKIKEAYGEEAADTVAEATLKVAQLIVSSGGDISMKGIRDGVDFMMDKISNTVSGWVADGYTDEQIRPAIADLI